MTGSLIVRSNLYLLTCHDFTRTRGEQFRGAFIVAAYSGAEALRQISLGTRMVVSIVSVDPSEISKDDMNRTIGPDEFDRRNFLRLTLPKPRS